MYDAKNGKEVKNANALTKDAILDGVIINIDDGKVINFLPESAREGWKGSTENPAINLRIEVAISEKETRTFEQMFTYSLQEGNTVYTPQSNLAKYAAKYDKLPEVGNKLKIITDGNGYGKVKLK